MTGQPATTCTCSIEPSDGAQFTHVGMTVMFRIVHCPLHAQAEETAEELATWRRVFEGYFGPEGRDVAIADKAVQDLQAELRMAPDDRDAAAEEREELVEALGKCKAYASALQWDMDEEERLRHIHAIADTAIAAATPSAAHATAKDGAG